MIVLSTSVHNAGISLYNIISVVLNNPFSAIRFYHPPHNFESAFLKKKISNIQSNLPLKKIRKRGTNKPKSHQKEGNNKDKRGNK